MSSCPEFCDANLNISQLGRNDFNESDFRDLENMVKIGSNLVLLLPRKIPVLNLVRLHQIFLNILSEKRL